MIHERAWRPLEWVGAARRELKAFPQAARDVVGRELDRVQVGGEPRDAKPMEGIGPGAREIRIRTFQGGKVDHRVVYVARFPEAVYVLHAFEKKTRKTSPHHLDLAAKRYKQMLRERQERKDMR